MATKFKKENFHYHGGYLTYEGKFVARFKYAMTSSRGTFVTFLIKNFTVEEFFQRTETESPLEVLESKGYILSHIKKWLKQYGFPVNQDGYKQFMEMNRQARAQ